MGRGGKAKEWTGSAQGKDCVEKERGQRPKGVAALRRSRQGEQTVMKIAPTMR
jgi:hypothetical protein